MASLVNWSFTFAVHAPARTVLTPPVVTPGGVRVMVAGAPLVSVRTPRGSVPKMPVMLPVPLYVIFSGVAGRGVPSLGRTLMPDQVSVLAVVEAAHTSMVIALAVTVADADDDPAPQPPGAAIFVPVAVAGDTDAVTVAAG
jgi:hypothetical protein